ncbi:MAG: hypothetical protein ACREO1_03390 [Arenimonas sp.]
MRIIFATCLLATMSSCTGYGVTFQTAPGTELLTCHPSLVGNWRVIEGERNSPASSTLDFLSVNADCSNIYAVTIKKESGKQESKVDDLKKNDEQKIQFVRGGTYDYAVITPKETSFEITPELTVPSGKIIYQINTGKDGVILRTVDLDKTIQLVLARKMNGQIFVDRDNPGVSQAANVYVRGDEKLIAGYLDTLDLYSNDRLLLVSATPAEVKLIQKAIKNYHPDKKSK